MTAGSSMASASPQPLVSVVVPIYNGAEVVADTLRSVLGQTHQNLEVIAVDDGSTDRTVQLIEEEFGGDERVRLVTQVNQGVAAARNAGLAEANGPLIAFVDSDDVWHQEKLAKQVALLERAGPDVGVVYTWYANIDRAGVIVPPLRPKPMHRGNVLAPLLLQNFVGNASTPLIRTSLLKRVGGYSRDLLEKSGGQGFEDWHLYLKLAEVCEFEVVAEFLTGYRQGRATMSRDVKPFLSNFHAARQDIWSRHPDLPRPLHLWSEIYLLAWMASRAWTLGQRITALGLLVRGAGTVIRNDPLLPFRPATRKFVRYALELRKHEGETADDRPYLGSVPVVDANAWRQTLELRSTFVDEIIR
ncbi:MAG: glycosyltransferase family 2 protein [Acidimicrobiia bacterium]|nr:glycosyltransferase family 2 protein [Acidimicrobiia bacterium]